MSDANNPPIDDVDNDKPVEKVSHKVKCIECGKLEVENYEVHRGMIYCRECARYEG